MTENRSGARAPAASGDESGTCAATARKVWIYKGKRREEAYLYLPAADCFDDVPEDLLNAMGELSLVLELDLSSERTLARANSREVLSSIESRGFYLQMPPLDAPRPVKVN